VGFSGGLDESAVTRGRTTMKLRTFGMAAIVALAFGCTNGSLSAQVPQWQMPPDSQRCPSKWGTGDQRGSGNLMKPETVLRAAKLIRTGEVFQLGFVLSADMPLIEPRRFDLHMKRSTTTKPGSRGSNEEIVITELGQVGTQFDGFAHQIYGGEYYNCFTQDDLETGDSGGELTAGGRQGFAKLGVENAPDMMTRGVLIDIAALKNVDILPGNYKITPEDLQQALAREKVTLEPGDAVMINTGWGKLYNTDKVRYLQTSPGIGVEAGEWLVKQNPMLVGADNCCLELRPYAEQKMHLPIHAMFIIANGIHIVENLKLDQLSLARAYETAYIMEILKIKGGTGSTIAPIAVR
jgi:kynurenine formamidase